MIIVIRGLLGSGKTLFLTYLGNKEKKLKVYGNFTLKIKDYTKVTPYDLENIKQGLILIDEAYSWFDSRTSNKQENLYLTNRIGFNSRKRGLTIVISAQLEGSIDLRFRDLADIVITANGFNNKLDGFVYTLEDRIKSYNLVIKKEHAEELFKIYDTYEPETDSIPTIFEPDRLNTYINKVVEVLVNEYEEKAYNLSKGVLNDFLINSGKGLPSRKVIEMVYNRLKRLKIEKTNL